MIAITLSNSVSAFRSGGIVSGTYEVTLQYLDNGVYYDVGADNPRLYLAVSKTASERWMFELNSPDSISANYSDYTNSAIININNSMSEVDVATAVYNAAVSAGFNVSRSGAYVTFTASQTGDLTDSVGFPEPGITPGT